MFGLNRTKTLESTTECFERDMGESILLKIENLDKTELARVPEREAEDTLDHSRKAGEVEEKKPALENILENS